MFVGLLREKFSFVFKYYSLVFRAAFQPYIVAKEIALGDPQDFKYRMEYFLTTSATLLAVQSILAWWIGIAVLSSDIDTFWQYLHPFSVMLYLILLYIPLRLFKWTKLPFSHYFQAAATANGVILISLPLSVALIVIAYQSYGILEFADPRISTLFDEFGTKLAQFQCSPKFDSLSCLGYVANNAPETFWLRWVQFFSCVFFDYINEPHYA